MKKVNLKKLRNQQKKRENSRYQYAISVIGDEISSMVEQVENKSVSERKKVFTNTTKLEEFTELLNLQEQHKMPTLDEVLERNDDISMSEIIDFLSSKNYIFSKTKINNENRKSYELLCHIPFSDLKMIPKYNAIENNVVVSSQIALSNEVAHKVDNYCENIRKQMRKEGKIPISREISDLIKKDKGEVLDRYNYALAIMDSELSNKLKQVENKSPKERGKSSFIETLNLEKLTELVNSQHQQEMMTIDELWEQNSDVSNGLIMDELVSKKYLCKIDFERNGEYYSEMITIRPFSDVMIIPVYDNMKNRIIFEQQIVISDEVVEEINKYCSKVRNKTLNK